MRTLLNITANHARNTQHDSTTCKLNYPSTSSSISLFAASYNANTTSSTFTTFSIALTQSYSNPPSILHDLKMYKTNASPSSRRKDPRSPEAIKQEVRELSALATHRLGPNHTNDHSVDELIHLNNMSLSENFQSNQNRRPVPGLNRNILHAAAIFDPTYHPPPPTTYQLPQRGPGYHANFLPGAYPAWESHQRNDSGYESASYMMMDDDEEDDGIDAWCNAVLSQGTQLDPNQHVFRPEAPCFEPGASFEPGAQDGVIGNGDSITSPPRNHSPEAPLSSIQTPKNVKRTTDDRFKVTDYEREVLDYEGLSLLSRCGPRDTQSEHVNYPPGGTRDTQSDDACAPFGYTWKFSHGSNPEAELSKEQEVDQRFKVTDPELEVLDYEGYNSNFGQSVRKTQSESSESSARDTRGTQSDTACAPLGYTRGFYHSDSSEIGDVNDQEVDDRSKMTDYDLDVLDHKRSQSKIGRGMRNTDSDAVDPPFIDTREPQSNTTSPSPYTQEFYSARSSPIDDSGKQKVDERFKVTDYELEVLDYEGFNSKIGQGVRDTQSERAESEGDEDFDEDRPIVRYQWSFSL